jgi:hypothetical protein
MEHMIVIAERGARVLRGKKPYKAILRMYPTQTYNTPERNDVMLRVKDNKLGSLNNQIVKCTKKQFDKLENGNEVTEQYCNESLTSDIHYILLHFFSLRRIVHSVFLNQLLQAEPSRHKYRA